MFLEIPLNKFIYLSLHKCEMTSIPESMHVFDFFGTPKTNYIFLCISQSYIKTCVSNHLEN